MFDFSQAQDWQNGFDPMPEGKYPATITGAQFMMNKSNTGEYLKLEFTFFGQQFNGRKIFNQYNLIHSNPKAAAIALSEVKAILLALGTDITKAQLNKEMLVQYLIDKTLVLHLGVKNDEQYGMQNKIKGYDEYQMPSGPVMQGHAHQPLPVQPTAGVQQFNGQPLPF